eukprot:4069259-Amphidinium_carterae.1
MFTTLPSEGTAHTPPNGRLTPNVQIVLVPFLSNIGSRYLARVSHVVGFLLWGGCLFYEFRFVITFGLPPSQKALLQHSVARAYTFLISLDGKILSTDIVQWPEAAFV